MTTDFTPPPARRPRRASNADGSSTPAARRVASKAVLAAALVGAGGAAAWHFTKQAHEATTARTAATSFELATAADEDAAKALDALVSCLTGVEAAAKTSAEFQTRLARGTGGQYASLGERIKAQCTPAFRAALDRLPPQFAGSERVAPAWTAFDSAARAFADEADQYAARLSSHAREDEIDQRMIEAARRWSEGDGADDESRRFESFFLCAVPDAQARADKQALSRWASRQCTQETPAYGAYIDRLRSECSAKLASGEPRTSEAEHAGLAAVRQAKVMNGTMSPAQFLFTVCAEHARRQWVGADGAALVRTFGDALGRRQMLTDQVAALKPRPPT